MTEQEAWKAGFFGTPRYAHAARMSEDPRVRAAYARGLSDGWVCEDNSEDMSKEKNERPYYVILTGEISNPVVFGGSHNLRMSERIMRNPLAFRKGAWKTMLTFPSERAAYESQYGPSLEIANGRFNWRPLSKG